MKAAIWTKYGAPEGIVVQDVPKPEPKDNEVRIWVKATSVIMGDCEMRGLALPLSLRLPVRLMNGWSAPRRFPILGQEFAGVIDSAGSGVSNFKPGEKVFGATGFGHGTYTEYICLPAGSEDDVFIEKPENLTFEQAAVVPVGALEALLFLRKGHIQRGEAVLVNGAGGSIGTVVVQLAKHLGAHVTAVDRAEKLDMLRSIGADEVIDYTKEDFTRSGKRYDVVFDVVGKAPYARCIRGLNRGGRYLLSNPSIARMLRSVGTNIVTGKTVVTRPGQRSRNDLREIKELIEAGKLKPVLDKGFTLEHIADAHAYVDSGRKQGGVPITVV